MSNSVEGATGSQSVSSSSIPVSAHLEHSNLYDPDQITKNYYMNYILQRKIETLKKQFGIEN